MVLGCQKVKELGKVTSLYMRATLAGHIEISSERTKHSSGPRGMRWQKHTTHLRCHLQCYENVPNQVAVDVARSHPRGNAKVAPAAVLSSRWNAKCNLRNLGDVLGVVSSSI
jgi:hypothetical protein